MIEFNIIAIETGTTFALLLLRITMIVMILPGVSARYISQRHRIIISFIFAYICLPSLVAQSAETNFVHLTTATTLFSEVLIGAMYGITFRSIIFSLQISGAIIAQSISIAQILGANVAHDAQSSISNILMVSGVTLLAISGFLEITIFTILDSYRIFPIGGTVDPHDVLLIILHSFKSTFQLSIQLSMPFLLLAAYYNLLLAVVNRSMPQLLVSFIGVPAVLAASLALFLGIAEPVLQEWRLTSLSYLQTFEP